MNLRKRAFRQLGGIVAVCAVAAACTQPSPQVPSPSPSPSPTPASSSPGETQLERETRLAFQGAEGAYRANIAEQNRLFAVGGSARATMIIKQTSTGQYLAFVERSLRAAKRDGWHTDHPTVIAGVTAGVFTSSNKVSISACEDNRKVHLVYGKGKVVTPSDSRLYLQTLSAEKTEGKWKISSLNSKQLQSFTNDLRCKS